MKKTLKRLCTGFLALATVVTALPTTPVHAESKQYWTESAERVGIIEKVMNDGSIGSTFNEGYMKVEGETAYCIDINTDFKNGYKTRADASSRMSADQISDVALSLEYVKQYSEAHKELNYKQVYRKKHTDPCRRNTERFFQFWLLCRFPASHYLSGGTLCCLYGTDKTGNQQGTSRCYQLCGGVRAVRFVYCLRSRLHQEDK